MCVRFSELKPNESRKEDSMSSIKRFMAKVSPEPNSGCWLWTGSCTPTGNYGSFWDRGKLERAHRWSYKHFHGPIESSDDVCHKCDNPPCVNPDHLFKGTRTDNILDSVKKGRWNHSGTLKFIHRTCSLFCGYGHRMFADNVVTYKGKRYCKTCAKVRRVVSNANRKRKCEKEAQDERIR